MQYWPRTRAKRAYPRIRSTPLSQEAKLLSFAGYKAGMTHVVYKDNRKNSLTKNQELSLPVTIIECPPLKAFSLSFYRQTPYGVQTVSHVLADHIDKELARKLKLPKKKKKVEEQLASLPSFDDVRVLCYTQPKQTGMGKKKPEILEIALGGKKEEKLQYAKSILGKEISIQDVFKEGDHMDIHAVTKGKGFQGPVKRFGISLRSHKSEKTKRGPGSLGPWKGQGHVMYRVAHAGQTGYQARTEYNKLLLKISTKPEDIKVKGGIVRYGFIKSTFIFVKGSVAGSKKRLIRFQHALRKPQSLPATALEEQYVSISSQQG